MGLAAALRYGAVSEPEGGSTRDSAVERKPPQKRDIIPPGASSLSMPELSLRPAQMAGALPPVPRQNLAPAAGSPIAASDDRTAPGEAPQAPLGRPPVAKPDSLPVSAVGGSVGHPRPRPSSPAARRPPGARSLKPPMAQPPASAPAAARSATPPPAQRRLAKNVPKSAGAAPRRPRPNTPPAPSPQQQLDRELYGLLHKSLRFVSWRVPQLPGSFLRVLPGRRTLLAASALVGLFLMAPHTPLSHWSNLALQSLTHNVKARAAFQVIDDFTGGVSDHWDSAGLVSDESGAARVTGFALNRNTMELAGYRLDFDAKIASRGMGWIIGAADERNYYAFKLEEVTSKQGTKYRLVRYLVSEGAVADSDRVQVDVPVELNQEDFNRISVRLRENRIATFINGTGVDYWQAEEAPHGGVGFFTESNETAFVRRVEVSGNEDTWGLFLYGFLELIEDAKGFVEPVTARFDSSPPPNPEPKSKAADPASLASVL